MKFLIVFSCVGMLQLCANVHAQQVSLRMKGATFPQVIRELEQQTGLTFLYHLQKVEQLKKMDVNVRQTEWREVLEQCLKGSGLSYKVVEKTVIITPVALPAGATQTGTKVKGVVKDRTGTPLPGVAILIKGTKVGISTDSDGRFELSLPEVKAWVLVFTFIGMKPQEVLYKGQGELTVVMEEQVTEMDEVVVTGILNKARESYTGAVTTITAKELKKFGNRSILSQIRNIDPAFNIVEDNDFGSDPNKLPNIQMRGTTGLGVDVKDLQQDLTNSSQSNLPLFILDGFEVSLQRVNDMDENLVETITLLKDASATAMYGSRGANGIVVITTKRPEPGRLRVTYKGDINIEFPDFSSYNLMDAREKLAYEVAAGIFEGGNAQYDQEYRELYNERLIAVERGVNTYWLKYPVRTGVGHRHSLRLDGGDEHFRYAAAVAYNNVAGIMKKSYRNTLSGNMYFSYRWKQVTFQNDLTLNVNKSSDSPYGSFSDYTSLNPYDSPYDEEGQVKKMLDNRKVGNRELKVANPLYDATLPGRHTNEYFSVQNNFAVEWTITSGLLARGKVSVTKQNGRSDDYLSAKHTRFEGLTGENYGRRGSYDYGTNYQLAYECDMTLNYSRVLGEKHSLYAGLNYNFAEDKVEIYQVSGEGFSALNMDNLGMASGYPPGGKPLSQEAHSRRVGALLNMNYTYDQRYFVDISGKMEGSSKFGGRDRLAPFWSAGLGWNIHHEKFLSGKEMIGNLRLRVSYGVSGSQNFDPYQALMTYRFYGEENYRNWNGAYLLGIGNEELGWQQTRQWDFGVEALLFRGRVKLNFDYYRKLTDDLLSDINIPTASGFNSYKANVGEVRNQGIEMNANVYVLRNTEKELVWSIGGSLAHNKNKILKISNSLEFLNKKLEEMADANPSFLLKEGQSMNTIFAVRSLGIDPANGQEVFVKKSDGSKTYVWNASDKVPCGVNEPKVWGNLNTLFRYKNWSLNVVMAYRMGGYLYNQTLIDKVENCDPWRNADRRVLYNRWQQEGDHVFFKSITNTSATKASSRFVTKENTLECRSVNIAYEVNSAWLRRHLAMEYLSVGVYGEDIFRLSTVKQERGLTYPFAHKFSVSLTARF